MPPSITTIVIVQLKKIVFVLWYFMIKYTFRCLSFQVKARLLISKQYVLEPKLLRYGILILQKVVT